eukprot:s522_g29.t1
MTLLSQAVNFKSIGCCLLLHIQPRNPTCSCAAAEVSRDGSIVAATTAIHATTHSSLCPVDASHDHAGPANEHAGAHSGANPIPGWWLVGVGREWQ